MKRRKRRTIRWIAWSLVSAFVIVATTYLYLTSPGQLKARLRAQLERTPGLRAEIGTISFRPWEGLSIASLALRTNDATRPDDAPLARFNDIKLGFSTWEALRDRLRITRVSIGEFELNLSRDADSDAANWRASSAAEALEELLAQDVLVQPSLNVRRGSIRFFLKDGARMRLLERWVVQLRGKADRDGYHLDAQRALRDNRMLADVHWRNDGRVRAKFGWLELDSLRNFLPGSLAQRLDELQLEGRVALSDVELAAFPPKRIEDVRRATIALERLNASLPVADWGESSNERTVAAQDRFVRLQDWSGEIGYDAQRPARQRFALQTQGNVNEAIATLRAFAPAALVELSKQRRPELSDLESFQMSIRGLELPTRSTHPHFVTSLALPEAVRDFFRNYEPAGPIDLELRLPPSDSTARIKATRDGKPLLEGALIARGATCHYFRFPYPFENARGRISFARGVTRLEGVRARHGSAQIDVFGQVDSPETWAGFDLRFRCVDVPLDRALYDALPAEYQRLWDRVAPLGLANVDVTVHREDGAETRTRQPVSIDVQTRLIAGSLFAGDLRLTEADGRIEVQDDVIRIRDLFGYADDGTLRVSGAREAASADDLSGLAFQLEGQGLPIDFDATMRVHERLTTVRFDGLADVWGRRAGSRGPGTSPDDDLSLRIRDGELTLLDPARPWQHVNGWVVQSGSQQFVRELVAEQDDTRLTIDGSIGGDRPANLAFHIQTPDVARVLPQFVPAGGLERIRAFGIRGAAEARVTLAADANGQQALTIEGNIDRLEPDAMPLPLRNATIKARIAQEQCKVESFAATIESGGEIAARGRFEWEGTREIAEWSVQAQRLKLEPALIGAMPPRLASLLTRIDATGDADVLLDRIRRESTKNVATEKWRLDGRVLLRQAALSLGIPLEITEGNLVGWVELLPGGDLEIAADISVIEGRLQGRPVSNWSGRLVRKVGDPLVQIESFGGNICGGKTQGMATIEPEHGAYRLSLDLQDVDLVQFVKRAPQQGGARGGWLSGHVHLTGVAGDDSSREGGGQLQVLRASFRGTPVLASIAKASEQVARRTTDDLDRIEIEFLWRGSELELTRVEIESRDLRLLGQGSWNLATNRIRAELVGAHPRHWPRIAIISDFVEAAGQEIMKYQIDGTPDRPTVRLEPLHNVNAAIRRLLSLPD